EPDGCLLRRSQAAFHARARVQEQREGDGQVRPVEEGHLLLCAVFKHVEVANLQVGHVVLAPVDDCNVQRNQLDARLERRRLASPRRLILLSSRGIWLSADILLSAGRDQRQRSGKGGKGHRNKKVSCSHGRPCSRSALTGIPLTVSPSFAASTVMRSGGIRVGGRA